MTVFILLLCLLGYFPGHAGLALCLGFLCELLVALCVAHSIRIRNDDELSSM